MSRKIYNISLIGNEYVDAKLASSKEVKIIRMSFYIKEVRKKRVGNIFSVM